MRTYMNNVPKRQLKLFRITANCRSIEAYRTYSTGQRQPYIVHRTRPNVEKKKREMNFVPSTDDCVI